MELLVCNLNALEATKTLALRLSKILRTGDLLVLSGDLGAGKTMLTKEILACWGIDHVLSPTFTLLHTYEAGFTVHHLDLYRLDRSDEVRDLGWEELLDGSALVIVEWLDKFPELLPDDYLCVALSYGEDFESRIAHITARGTRGTFLLKELKQKC